MTSAPTQVDASSRTTPHADPIASATDGSPANCADAGRVQVLHEAVEAARRFGLLQENF